jgi:hypothetical protein
MPIMNLAEEIGRYLPGAGAHGGSSSPLGNVVGAAAVGGLLGELFGGNNRD